MIITIKQNKLYEEIYNYVAENIEPYMRCSVHTSGIQPITYYDDELQDILGEKFYIFRKCNDVQEKLDIFKNVTDMNIDDIVILRFDFLIRRKYGYITKFYYISNLDDEDNSSGLFKSYINPNAHLYLDYYVDKISRALSIYRSEVICDLDKVKNDIGTMLRKVLFNTYIKED